MRTVSHRKAPRLDGVARFEIIRGDADPLKCRTANRLHDPYLRIARSVLNLNVDPRVRHDKMHFLHYAFNVRISVGVLLGEWCADAAAVNTSEEIATRLKIVLKGMLTSLHELRKIYESPLLPSRSCARRVNPVATLKIAVDARRRRKSVHIDLLIAKPNSSFVEKYKRLREPARLRIPRRYGGFH